MTFADAYVQKKSNIADDIIDFKYQFSQNSWAIAKSKFKIKQLVRMCFVNLKKFCRFSRFSTQVSLESFRRNYQKKSVSWILFSRLNRFDDFLCIIKPRVVLIKIHPSDQVNIFRILHGQSVSLEFFTRLSKRAMGSAHPWSVYEKRIAKGKTHKYLLHLCSTPDQIFASQLPDLARTISGFIGSGLFRTSLWCCVAVRVLLFGGPIIRSQTRSIVQGEMPWNVV